MHGSQRAGDDRGEEAQRLGLAGRPEETRPAIPSHLVPTDESLIPPPVACAPPPVVIPRVTTADPLTIDLNLRGAASGGSANGHRKASFLASVMAHLLLVLIIGTLLKPAMLGEGGPLVLDLSQATADPLADGLALSDDLSFGDTDEEQDGTAPDAFIPGVGEKPPPGSSARGSRGRGSGSPRGEFFGTVAYGDRFVYVLDVSGSMSRRIAKARSTRLDYAIEELLRSVSELSEDQSFFVYVFSTDTRPMFDEKRPIPELIPATADNKLRLRQWLYDMGTGGGTDPRLSVRNALRMLPSAVFLLSDGEFNGRKNRKNRSALHGNPRIEEVVAANNMAGIPIHTIAFLDEVNRERMKALAKQTGGEYRYVAPSAAQTIGFEPASTGSQDRRQRSDVLANVQLQRAESLEKQQSYAAALTRYRFIVSRFPTTEAASVAKRQMQRLREQPQPRNHRRRGR